MATTDAAGLSTGTAAPNPATPADTRGSYVTASVTDLEPTDPAAGEPNPPGASLVPIVADNVPEPAQSFGLQLSHPQGGVELPQRRDDHD